MQLQFSQEDSLYKIFKTLKRVPPYKRVTISLEKWHEIFEHDRRAHQLAELIIKQHLTAEFITNTLEEANTLRTAWLTVTSKQKTGINALVDKVKEFFFSTGSIHKQLLSKKNTQSYLILAAEIAVLIVVGIFFWWLVSPKATVIITPTNSIKPVTYQYHFYPYWSWVTSDARMHGQISIPYQMDTIPYTHEMTIDVQDVTYSYSPAHGVVQLQNTTDEVISLVWGTQLITSWSILFTLDRWVNVPIGTPENPWTVNVSVTARDYTDSGDPIWVLGNIPRDTELLIKNLPISMDAWRVKAIAIRWFTDWETIGIGTILQKDIESIEQKILAFMEDNKKKFLQENTSDPTRIILPFDQLITFSVEEFISTSTVWDSATFVDGRVKADLSYLYIKKSDLIEGVEMYLEERPTDGLFLLDIDQPSVTFFELNQDNEWEQITHFSIPTRINTIWWYNFGLDNNMLGEEMKSKIAWLTKEEAKQELLLYDLVLDSTIRLSPPRYDTLPQEIERIEMKHIAFDS